MKRLFNFAFLIIALIFGIVLMNNHSMKAKEIPLKDFFRNPDKSSFQISKDGKYFAYLAPFQNRMNIFVQEIGNSEAKRITEETDRDISGYFWASNTRILYLKDKGGDENFKLYGVDYDGGNSKCLTDFDKVRVNIIDDLEDFQDLVIIGMNKRNPEVFDPYRLNIVTGELTMLAENPGNITGWLTDHDGKLRLATTSDGVNTSILYRETENDKFKTIITNNFKESVSPEFFTFDNKNLYAISNLGRDKSAVVEFDLQTGKEITTLYENPEYDVEYLSYSRKRHVITAASFESWKRERHYFDKEAESIMKKLEKKFPKYEVAISSRNKDEDKFIVVTYSDRSLGAYYFYDKNTDKLELLEKMSPWLDEKDMAEMKPIEFNSRDGLKLHGYITYPKGSKGENMPVVVNPHGGPWARDSWGFNPEVQFLANRGYVVLQINYRGSTGYGRKFWEASFKEWGKKMQDDITDGVNYLINMRIADKNKIAIYGGSYGGYATLAGITFTPQIYAAAVDYVGVSNLFTFMKTVPPYWKTFLDMMYEMVGNPEKDSVLLREASPVFHVDNIKTPLFIAQGANDPRVNKNESDQMVEALKNRGVDVEYMVKDNEGHGFHNEENRFDFYGAMEKFLAKYLKKS